MLPQVPPAASGGSARGARAKLPVLLPLAGSEALASRAAEPGTCEHKSPVERVELSPEGASAGLVSRLERFQEAPKANREKRTPGA